MWFYDLLECDLRSEAVTVTSSGTRRDCYHDNWMTLDTLIHSEEKFQSDVFFFVGNNVSNALNISNRAIKF